MATGWRSTLPARTRWPPDRHHGWALLERLERSGLPFNCVTSVSGSRQYSSGQRGVRRRHVNGYGGCPDAPWRRLRVVRRVPFSRFALAPDPGRPRVSVRTGQGWSSVRTLCLDSNVSGSHSAPGTPPTDDRCSLVGAADWSYSIRWNTYRGGEPRSPFVARAKARSG